MTWFQKTYILLLMTGFSINPYTLNVFAQNLDDEILESMNDDLEVGSDIFGDFSEAVESTKIMEDERFFKYGRFFAVNMGIGMTSFTGNRGAAYRDAHPSYNLSILYFMDFRSAIVFGMQYSKHVMKVDTPTRQYPLEEAGTVDISMLRPFFGYRYYIDPADLGTVITYSNPYFTGRLEYWYQTNKFVDRPDDIPEQKGGGLGAGLGMGLEFPMKLRESYFNIEFLMHMVNWFDRDYNHYDIVTNDQRDNGAEQSEFGYPNLRGFGYSLVMSYTMSW